ncbi:MAG: hypothetical protein M1450_04120 [Patescibacteria group bacterium]|nr:hypothetical protein [Patescibacteria group bacterium]
MIKKESDHSGWPEKYNTQSLWNKTLVVGNRHRNIEEIPQRLVVEPSHFFLSAFHENSLQISEGEAARRIEREVSEDLRAGKVVVFIDNSKGRVIGLRSVSARKVEVAIINRFGVVKDPGIKPDEDFSLSVNSKILVNPKFSYKLSNGKFVFGIKGTTNGRENGDPFSFKMSSEGPLRPRKFIIATDQEVIFGQTDAQGSLEGIWEYKDPKKTHWNVSGAKREISPK